VHFNPVVLRAGRERTRRFNLMLGAIGRKNTLSNLLSKASRGR
jgi:hypothetical protein